MAPDKATQNRWSWKNVKDLDGHIVAHTMGDRTEPDSSLLKRFSQLLNDCNFLSRFLHKTCSRSLPRHRSDMSGDRMRRLLRPLLFALRRLISVCTICRILESRPVPPLPTDVLREIELGEPPYPGAGCSSRGSTQFHEGVMEVRLLLRRNILRKSNGR